MSAAKARPALLATDLDELSTDPINAGIDLLTDHTLANAERCFAPDPFGNRIAFIHNDDRFSQR